MRHKQLYLRQVGDVTCSLVLCFRRSGGANGGFPFTLEPVDGSEETRVFELEAPSDEARSDWLSAFSRANIHIGAWHRLRVAASMLRPRVLHRVPWFLPPHAAWLACGVRAVVVDGSGDRWCEAAPLCSSDRLVRWLVLVCRR